MMIDEQEIEDLKEEMDELSVESDNIAPDKTPDKRSEAKPRFVGYKTLGLATLLAAIMGTIGGTGLSKFTTSSGPDLASLNSQLEKVQSENQALKAQLTRLQSELKKPRSAAKVDLSGIQSRMAALEKTNAQILKTQNETSTPKIDPDLVARLEALQEEGSPALDLSDIKTRLDKVETDASTAPSDLIDDREALIAQLKTEILADETFLQTLTPIAEASNPNAAVIDKSASDETLPRGSVLPPFPKASILRALDEADASLGWVKRTLNKNITVQSEDNPRYLVELIEMDLKSKDYSEALAKFDKLPELAKMAGKDWRDAFKGK